MKPSVEKLYKFLKLESEHGFDDRAVMGGLRGMLASWETEARAEEVPPAVIQAVTARLRDYHQLTPGSREEILSGLWKRMQRSLEEPLPDLILDSPRPTPVRKTTLPPASRSAGAAAQTVKPETSQSAPPIEIRQGPSRQSLRLPKPVPIATGEEAALEAPLTVIKGIGPKMAESLERLGLRTLGDALYFFPRRYDDFQQLKPINRLTYSDQVTVIGTIERIQARPLRNGKAKMIEAVLQDGSGGLRVTWFNQPWLVDQLRDQQVVLSGKVDQYLGRLVMTSPEWELLEQKTIHTRRIVPVYPLTEDVTQKWLRNTLDGIVSFWADRVQDPLPDAFRIGVGVAPLAYALRQIHFPDSWDALEQARHRLAFDEILLIQLGVLQRRHAWTARSAVAFESPAEWWQERIAELPFPLTGAQSRALNEVRSDLASGRPMNRLLQGDVGSGKTVVAALAIDCILAQRGQAAVMAPTGILAEQHYNTFRSLLATGGGARSAEEIALLLGSTPAAEKEAIRLGLKQGAIKLVIGTHALLEADVEFQRLQLIVIDEQHRFGVEQRTILREKGSNAHLLVMTATPIPRSLALTIYGDLDVAVIDEMPPGRQPVRTYLLRPVERERAYTRVQREVADGRQVFIIYPLVEETARSEAKAAVEEHARLQTVFPRFTIGLLHGRLTPEEKENAMLDFRQGKTQILVSTSVVEVGVDIPNATLIVIEGANRFGLAQLHQFRGRVGRGDHASLCLLIPDSESQTENERLNAMVESNDGFALAERDLEQRGPGEFLGTRQSGFTGLRLARLTDLALIEQGRQAARQLIESDPGLTAPQHGLLLNAVQNFWRNAGGENS